MTSICKKTTTHGLDKINTSSVEILILKKVKIRQPQASQSPVLTV